MGNEVVGIVEGVVQERVVQGEQGRVVQEKRDVLTKRIEQVGRGRVYLKIGDVAAMLSVSRQAVWEMIEKGELPSVKMSGIRRRVPLSAVEAYLSRGEWTLGDEGE
jgi:excisionase family DNA binding protein